MEWNTLQIQLRVNVLRINYFFKLFGRGLFENNFSCFRMKQLLNVLCCCSIGLISSNFLCRRFSINTPYPFYIYILGFWFYISNLSQENPAPRADRSSARRCSKSRTTRTASSRPIASKTLSGNWRCVAVVRMPIPIFRFVCCQYQS